jgi:hypothetical protein
VVPVTLSELARVGVMYLMDLSAMRCSSIELCDAMYGVGEKNVRVSGMYGGCHVVQSGEANITVRRGRLL